MSQDPRRLRKACKEDTSADPLGTLGVFLPSEWVR